MNILLFSTVDEATGNATTAARIRGHLESAGYRVVHAPADRAWAPAELGVLVERERIALAIGIHAYGSGKHLRHLSVPTILVFGGTDLNELVRDPPKLAVMTEAVSAAFALVSFDDHFVRQAIATWPQAASKTRAIPQATDVYPSSFSFRQQQRMKPGDRLFLLPSGLRPVKDPLFCAAMFSAWHREDSRVRYAIVGAVRDPVYAKEVEQTVVALPGVSVHSALPRGDLHAAIREADIMLNTSVSESSPNAVLEAMALGTPVLIRDIPGNRSIVEHRKTGLLFTDPEGCRALAEELLCDPVLRKTVVENALRSIRERHNPDAERQEYLDIVRDVIGA